MDGGDGSKVDFPAGRVEGGNVGECPCFLELHSRVFRAEGTRCQEKTMWGGVLEGGQMQINVNDWGI